ncbi:MAG: hypothetical protein FDZ70_00215 [Actinobacteria bacterium]|nr:MAG: hypothetical protein FDZ70_00215 [Actinomycetota bacterium]
MSPSFLIATHADAEHATGHLRRSLTLAEALRSRGHDVAVQAPDTDYVRVLASAWCPNGGGLRLEGLAGSVEEADPDVVVFDLPRSLGPVSDVRAARVAALDRFDFADERIDLFVDLFVPGWARPEHPLGERLAEGLQFSMVRPEVAAERDAAGAVRNDAGRVLVLFGGSDAGGMTARALAQMADAGIGAEVDVVVGPGVPGLDPQVPGADAFDARVHVDPPDLPRLMASADLAVSGGGTTLLELMCLGRPTVVAPRTADESEFAHAIAAQGGCLVVDPAEEDAIGTAVRELASDARARERLSECARALVDGRGPIRIAESLEALT